MKLFTKVILVLMIGFLFIQNSYSMVLLKSIENLVNISNLITVNNYTPMTHYQEGDSCITVSPTYFKEHTVDTGTTIKYNGQDLNGWCALVAASYAMNNYLMLYMDISRVSIEGGIIGTTNNTTYTIEDGNNTADTFKIGCGVDIAHIFTTNNRWSMPLMLGIMYQRFNLDVTHTDYPNQTYQVVYSVNGSGSYFNYFLGISLSYKTSIFNVNFKITPYILYIPGPTGEQTVDATVVQSGMGAYPVGYVEEEEISGNISGWFPGFSLTYVSENNWSFSLSLGGLIGNRFNFYNERVFNGLAVDIYSISITYNVE